jgi:transcriptional regulator with XRE-family HTH domain
MEFLAKHLQELRKAKKLSRQTVADAIGISARSYQRYENNEREPTASTLVALADFYGVTIDELVGRTSA